MKEREAEHIADLIDTALVNRDDADTLKRVFRSVSELCHRFPMEGL
jgi:glycine/serine hydroxymethyltransferase